VGRALIARGIRTSPTLGTPAAAAAAAALYRLDAGAATHAIGIASSITGGVLEPVRCGSDEWRIQNAHAACGGLLAAQLAARGVRGAPQGLEGPKGLAHAFAGLDAVPEWDHEPRTESLLEVWAKPWATLGDNVPAVAAAHALRDSGAAPQRIAAVRVTIWRHYADYPGTAYRGPFDSVAQALASTAFGVAAMLAIGRLDYAVSAERRNDPAILRLVSCVTVTAHDGAWHEAEVEVELDDGSRISRRSADAPRTLLFHDETAAAAVFEHRLAEAGVTGGKALAGAVFGAAHGAPLAVAELLDRLSSPQRRRQA
jgi:2-methylcitrate dehydratase PrpD